MTHTFDTKNRGIGTSNPETVSITPTTGASLLVLTLMTAGIVDRTGGIPTFNGADLTLVSKETAEEINVEMWYLIDPSIGTYDVLIPNTSSNSLFCVASVFKAQAGYDTEYDTFNEAWSDTGSPSIDLTTQGDGCAIVEVCGDGYALAPTSGNKTELYSVDDGTYSDNHQYELQDSAGLTTFTWTVGSNDWCSIIASFKEVAAGASSTDSVDGTLIILDKSTSNVDGKVNIKDTVAGIFDGKLNIPSVIKTLFDGLLQIPRRYRIEASSEPMYAITTSSEQQHEITVIK